MFQIPVAWKQRRHHSNCGRGLADPVCLAGDQVPGQEHPDGDLHGLGLVVVHHEHGHPRRHRPRLLLRTHPDGGWGAAVRLIPRPATRPSTSASCSQSADASYTFVYVAHTDTTGHTFGWCGQRYLNMIDFADGLVGQLLDVIDEAGLTDEVTVLLSTDHGGHNFSHGSWQDSDIVIPLFVRGPGFRKNEEFRHEVRNWDLAPTALEVLGVKQSPWWKGKVLSEAFV